MSDEPAVKPASAFKRGVAAVLDFFTVFFVGGSLIAGATGETTTFGFSLTGWSAFGLFALIVAYFYVGRKKLGGTLWDRILGIARPQPY